MSISKTARRCARSLMALALGGGFCEKIANATTFKIERPGLTDPPHKVDGSSLIDVFDPDGAIGGCTSRYNAAGAYNGCTAWVLDNGNSRVAGLFGSEFTRNDGFYNSSAFRAGGDGQFAGWTNRYNSTSTQLGQAVWFYDHGTTTRMGLFDAVHTDTTGKQDSHTVAVNDAGYAVGTSQEFPSGQSVWIFRNAITTKIGLTGAEYTSNGRQTNLLDDMNDLGQVAGSTYRVKNGSSALGRASWIYSGGVSARIGLIDAAHTRSDGWQYSWLGNQNTDTLNNAGQVAGLSQRFSGLTDMGYSAWIYSGGVTQRIGLIGGAYVRADGYQEADVLEINEAGDVSGLSYIYNPTNTGTVPWIYHAGVSTAVGLTDAEHTGTGNLRISHINEFNDHGQAAGFSGRYSGTVSLGTTAWIYNNGQTTRIGLYGPQYIRADGTQVVMPVMLNEAAQVMGYSEQYSGSTTVGRSAWLYRDGATRRLGITDALHTGLDGRQSSNPKFLNELGWVAGTSTRFNGTNDSWGGSCWLYDSNSDQTFAFVYPSPPDVRVSCQPEFLAEDGSFIWTFEWNINGQLYDDHYFWSPQTGMQNLEQTIEGGLAGNGWSSLGTFGDGLHAINRFGQIMGDGRLSNGMTASYVLTPVPEPGVMLLILAAATLGLRRVRPASSLATSA